MFKSFNLDKFSDRLLDKLMPVIDFFNKPFPKAIQIGFSSMIPILTFGAFTLLINMLATPGGFTEGVTILPFLSGLRPVFTVVYYITFSFIAIPAVFFISNAYARELKTDDRLAGGMSIVVMLAASITSLDEVGGLPLSNLGAGGLVTAMLVAWGTVRMMKFCYDHNINIRMPKEVPPAVADTFKALVPFALIMIVFLTLNAVGFNVSNIITTLLTPILSLGDNFFSFMLWIGVRMGLWFFGIHGDNVLSPIAGPLMTQWTLLNTEAYMAGAALPHVWTDYFIRATTDGLAICFCLMFLSKLPQLKAVGRIALPCALFNIGEPLLFGLPLVMNPILYLPYYLIQFVNGGIAYIATSIGFMARCRITLPFIMPPIIGIPLANGDFVGSTIVAVIQFAVDIMIFLPFLKVYEKQIIRQNEASALEANTLEIEG